MITQEIQLSTAQKAAEEMAINFRVSIFSGYAGTGKTTALKSILSRLAAMNRRVRCVCPTGKAAKRMTECTGVMASTIHRVLDPMPDNDGNFVFTKDGKNPIDADVFIMDESSMVNVALMADFLRAVPDHASILFVGDPGQLPPVGHGMPFKDLFCCQHINRTELTEIFRNSGVIIENATKIRNGETFRSPGKMLENLDPENGLNMLHIEAAEIPNIISAIKTAHKWAKESGFDPIWDTQVVTPTNESGALSCKALNDELRFFLLPETGEPELDEAGKEKKPALFRVGEKVIQTKNDILPAAEDMNDMDDLFASLFAGPEKHYVVNGDIGKVLEAEPDEKRMKVRFFDPVREVWIRKTSPDVRHAFVVTCHKMQGSEAPVVIIPVHKSNSFIMNNPWIYTAVTRGKSAVITIGTWSTVEKAIQRPGNKRKTFLGEKLGGQT